MRNILLVMKNNLYRFVKDKSMMVMVVLVMPIIICFGVYFNGSDNIKGNIAVVGASIEEREILQSLSKENDKINVEFLEESPSKTKLIKGVYLAEIDFKGNKPVVTSYGKEDIKKSLEASLNGEIYQGEEDITTVQGRIIGFLIMFLFMGATTMVMDFFLADRESGAYNRVLSGRLSYYQYILGQMLYAILILSIPTTVWSVAILKILNVNLDISYSLLVFLLLLVGILSSSVGMLIATVFKDRVSASMGGSIIIMVTSLLGGCLINIQDTNKVIGFIRDILPQKRLIDLSNNFNNSDLTFVVGTIVVFILISVFLGKRQYESGKFIV